MKPGDGGSHDVGGADAVHLAAARTGDRRAFDHLCEAHRQGLHALCNRFLDRREDAEDVVQEVFARAWQRLGSFRGDASFRTWLWEIGRNLCLNQLRARRTRLSRATVSMEAATGEPETLEVPDRSPTPEETVVDAAHVAQIRHEVARHAIMRKWQATDWELFLLRIETNIPYADFAARHGRDEAYWRNRWRDKIKPVLERVREELTKSAV